MGVVRGKEYHYKRALEKEFIPSSATATICSGSASTREADLGRKGPVRKGGRKGRGGQNIREQVQEPVKGGILNQRSAKGAGGKGPRQKTSKIVKKCQKYFRHFSTIFAQGKKRQKSSKSVKKFFDTFRQFSRGTFFPAPLAIR